MPNYEYKVVPAPKKGLKGKGIKGSEERFANALMSAMNELGAEGWEYQRSDTLPCEERSGLRGRTTTFQNMLVFRREILVEAKTPEVAETVDAAPFVATAAVAAVAADTVAETHAPLLDGATPDDNGAAPSLGPATEATEVKDPRTNVAAQ